MSKECEKAHPSRILLVAITRMGDMLQGSPTISGLKKSYPGAKLTVLVEKQFASICEGIPGIDEVYIIDIAMIYRSLSRDGVGAIDAYDYFSQVVADLKEKNFDLCINMSSSSYTAILLRLLDIPDSRGWTSDEQGYRLISNPWSMLFGAYVYHSNRDFNSFNIVDTFRSSAGVKDHPHTLQYQPSDESRSKAAELLNKVGIGPGTKYLCVQAGASQQKRQWAPRRFARLAQLLIEQEDLHLVFTGSKGEIPIIEAVFSHYRHEKMASIAGATSLDVLGAILERSQLLITGDTGPMHLSIATGTPVVALFVASAYCFETGPYGPGNLIIEPQVMCYPCNPNYPCGRPDCHDQVSPELVTELVGLRLRSSNESLEQVRLESPLIDPDHVAVYCSVFDEEGFLDFKLISQPGCRRGVPYQFFQAARQAYRVIWKEDFGFLERSPLWDSLADWRESHSNFPSLAEVVALARSGLETAEALIEAISDPNSDPTQLGQLSAELEMIDQQIANAGLASEALGAMTRMFVMEKQNLQGFDALALATSTRELYQSLESRALRFGVLFDHYYNVDYGQSIQYSEQQVV